MDVRVLVLVEVAQAIDHGSRLLRRGGVVQPHEPATVHPLLQDREIAAYELDVEARAERAPCGDDRVCGEARSARARARGARMLQEVEREPLICRLGAGRAADVRGGNARRHSREEGAKMGLARDLDRGHVHAAQEGPGRSKSGSRFGARESGERSRSRRGAGDGNGRRDAGRGDAGHRDAGRGAGRRQRSRGHRHRPGPRQRPEHLAREAGEDLRIERACAQARITCTHGTCRWRRPRARRGRLPSTPRASSRAR